MTVLNKVTILVEPLGGSPGQKVVFPRAGQVTMQNHYDEPDRLVGDGPPLVTPDSNRLIRSDLEIPVFSDPQTGISYEVTRL